MRLISLTANQDSFHPVIFNKSGVSLITGTKKDPDRRDDSRTYNGVGKSLIIALIHFCLGSNKIKAFKEKIPDWEFTLKFEHRGEEITVTRSTSSQDRLIVDGVVRRQREFASTIEKEVFNLPEPIKYLTFRSLICSFIRRQRSSYEAFDKAEPNGTPYQQKLRMAFLLGLDVGLIIDKNRLRMEKEDIRKLRENLQKDPIFIEFFTQNKDPDIELQDLNMKIARLEKKLQDFEVAEDYHERQEEANEVTKEAQKLRNQIALITNAIKNIDQSLKLRPDLAPDQLFKVYEEAQVALAEAVKHTVEKVADFHKNLLETRIIRLTAEKNKLLKEEDTYRDMLEGLNDRSNHLMQFLGTHGALDEFVALTNELSYYKGVADKLEDYKKLIEKYSNSIQRIAAAMSNDTIRANEYLNEIKPLLLNNLSVFRSFSERFYGERPGGLTVKNNEGDNQIRFDINAHIKDDASDGINEVKIFCFDMTVLTLRHNHEVNFIFHDSRLFSNMDPRQAATAFKIAKDVSSNQGTQYIASVNQDQLEKIREYFDDQEYSEFVEDAVVLELTDEGASGKLLGIEVDMQYEA
jgi:uncharacterized protein YydD (DUF2326 family)